MFTVYIIFIPPVSLTFPGVFLPDALLQQFVRRRLIFWQGDWLSRKAPRLSLYPRTRSALTNPGLQLLRARHSNTQSNSSGNLLHRSDLRVRHADQGVQIFHPGEFSMKYNLCAAAALTAVAFFTTPALAGGLRIEGGLGFAWETIRAI